MAEPETDAHTKERIMDLLQPAGKAPRVMSFSLLYRKLCGRTLDRACEARLLGLLEQLISEGRIARYPDIGVAEPPYIAV